MITLNRVRIQQEMTKNQDMFFILFVVYLLLSLTLIVRFALLQRSFNECKLENELLRKEIDMQKSQVGFEIQQYQLLKTTSDKYIKDRCVCIEKEDMKLSRVASGSSSLCKYYSK